MRPIEATLDVYEWWKDRYQGKLPARGVRRSPDWRSVRTEHLTLYPECFCCGGTKNLEVHHIVPFSIAPDIELDPANLLTLCSSKKYGVHCHLLIGHCGNYREWNPFAVLEGTLWNYRLRHREQIGEALVNALEYLESVDFNSSFLHEKIKQYEHTRLCW